MNYRNKTSGDVSTQGEIRRANANTSFPRVWDADVCTHLNIDPVLAAPQPSCTALQQVSSVAPVQDDLNNWVEGWAVVDKFSDTTVDGVTTTKAEHEAAYTASELAKVAAAVREKRNGLLAVTDWTGNSDVTMTIEMTAYRTLLRNLTTQADFPTAINWPIKPQRNKNMPEQRSGYGQKIKTTRSPTGTNYPTGTYEAMKGPNAYNKAGGPQGVIAGQLFNAGKALWNQTQYGMNNQVKNNYNDLMKNGLPEGETIKSMVNAAREKYHVDNAKKGIDSRGDPRNGDTGGVESPAGSGNWVSTDDNKIKEGAGGGGGGTFTVNPDTGEVEEGEEAVKLGELKISEVDPNTERPAWAPPLLNNTGGMLSGESSSSGTGSDFRYTAEDGSVFSYDPATGAWVLVSIRCNVSYSGVVIGDCAAKACALSKGALDIGKGAAAPVKALGAATLVVRA